MKESLGRYLRLNWVLLLIGMLVIFLLLKSFENEPSAPSAFGLSIADSAWQAPSLNTDRTLKGAERELVIYGQELIAHTAKYIGPEGVVSSTANGMNCQNCHLNGGRQAWGNNFGSVASSYPLFRPRSGTVENITKRINDCFERSLNGEALDTASKEMQAIQAYILWVGKNVPKGSKANNSGIRRMPLLERAADPIKGKSVYIKHCSSCHGNDGMGLKEAGSAEYVYPPLWGNNSYNTAAGLYRLSSFAGYVHDNMPQNISSYRNPLLSNEEAWDVAAYVNSQPRPSKIFKEDWPDITRKPFDHPFGPYHDGFSEKQHKYGPFQPIRDERNRLDVLNKKSN